MSRCVICGYPKESHGENLACLGSAGVAGKRYCSMDLPTGKTCSDCHFFYFCKHFIGPEIAANTTCDWYPSRFLEKPHV